MPSGGAIDFWKKPQDYAKFLAEELAFVYDKRLLVIMPNGYGYAVRL